MSDSGVEWLDDDQQVAWRSYIRSSRALETVLDTELQSGAGMSLSEYELLSMLSEVPDRVLRMSTLADLIVQSRSRVTHTAKRLEDRGWVRRERSAEDGRGVEILLTDEGRAAIAELAPRHVGSVRRHLVDALTHDQLVALGEAMAVIRDQLRPNHHEIGIDD